jgi:hypothetical protein
LLALVTAVQSADKQPAPAVTLCTPDSELADAQKFLEKVPAEDAPFFRFFTTYSIPEKVLFHGEQTEMRHRAELALPFVLNSCQGFKGEGLIQRPKRVAGSNTLWYIDIRDFGWKFDDIDAVFGIQPYFLAPLVNPNNNSIIFRVDWFLVNAMDVTKQDDRGLKDLVYYILQYGKGNEPKDADDFRKTWQVDIKTIREQKVETGTVVDAGDSGVSQHTRQLRRGRTIFGYYRETRDVKSHDFDPDKIQTRDYVEDIFANQSDAGEYIATAKTGLQTYMLSAGNNGKFKRVEFGDPTIVVDRQDRYDPRVRTGKSCVICHANGVIPYTNAIREFFRTGGDIRTYSKDLAREIRAFYLRSEDDEVEADNLIFTAAVKRCNGLDPAENMACFHDVYEWYWTKKVTLEQAALELGLCVEDFKKAIKPATTGRLTNLYHDKPMPREVWDSINVGGYIQAMLLVKNLQAKSIKVPEGTKKTDDVRPREVKVGDTVQVTVKESPLLDSQDRVTVYCLKDVTARVLEIFDDTWYFVECQGHKGYLRKSHARLVR